MNWAMPLAPRGLSARGSRRLSFQISRAKNATGRSCAIASRTSVSHNRSVDVEFSSASGLFSLELCWAAALEAANEPSTEDCGCATLSELLSPAVQSPLTAASSHPATKHGPRVFFFRTTTPRSRLDRRTEHFSVLRALNGTHRDRASVNIWHRAPRNASKPLNKYILSACQRIVKIRISIRIAQS